MKRRILVVDDLAFMRTVLKDILARHGYDLAGEADNGRDAVISYARLKPDLVLLDIAMPLLDGISALNRIMRYDSSARVVMCSALGEQELIIKAVQIGAKDFIVKPFLEGRVVSAVGKALKSR